MTHPATHRLHATPASIGCGRCHSLWEEVRELRQRNALLVDELRRATERIGRLLDALMRETT